MTITIIRLALAECRANATRLLLTAAAIIGGVGFLAGTLVYGDTARAAFYDDLARSARNVDVAVRASYGPFDGRIDPSELADLRGLPELSHVDGRYVEPLGLVGADGKLLTNFNRPGYGVSVPGDPTLAGFDVLSGRLPQSETEAAVDSRTAKRQGFTLGGTVKIVGEHERTTTLTLVGILDFGINKRWSGLSVVVLTPQLLTGLTESPGYAEIVATAAPGVTENAAVAAVSRASPRGDVVSGSALRHELAVEAAKYVDGFQYILIAFAIVALVVSGFVIINTFTILGAQRSRQLALLRCIGAGRGQIYGMVLLESLVLGLAASAVGALASLVMGWVLLTGREAVATELPDHALVLRPFTVAVALLVGTVTTAAAALLPALQASRVPPLAALGRAAAIEGRPGRRPLSQLLRIAVAAVLGLLGAAMMLGAPPGFAAMPWVFGGGSVVGAAIILLAPLVAGRVVRAVGWLPGRVFGVPARLAATQSGRHPRRTAATATALMIGVALMSTLTVLVQTAQEQSRRELAENFPIDFQLNPVTVRLGGPPPTIEPGVVADVRARPEFDAVAAVRTRDWAFAEGEPTDVWTADGLGGKLIPDLMSGSLTGLAPGRAAVGRQLAALLDLSVGDSFDLSQAGKLTVIAVYDDAPTKAQVLLAPAQFATAFGERDGPDLVLVDVAPAVGLDAGRAALTSALATHPLVRISTQAETRDELSGKFNELMTIFGGLLAVSVLIAMFGISNNLALSVLERTRESSTLRALGLSKAQLRGALLIEAVLVALVGGGVGIVFGGAVGWLAARGLIDVYGHGDPTIPWAGFALYLLIAVLTAIGAALLPARRAARTSIIAGLSAE